MLDWVKIGIFSATAILLVTVGYKMGSWREGAVQAAALAQCKEDLRAQRETDLTGANHALAEELEKASKVAHNDAIALGNLAKVAQENARSFADDTRALYASTVGGCTVGPDLVRVLNEASDQANRGIAIGDAGTLETARRDATGPAVPYAPVRPPAEDAGAASADRWRAVDSGSRSVRIGAR
jgi:hypothetical protein